VLSFVFCHVASIQPFTCGLIDRFFKQMSLTDLADSELHRLRMQTCERMAKLMIDDMKEDAYLFTDVLLKRYIHGKVC
jgi:hypothetical protein